MPDPIADIVENEIEKLLAACKAALDRTVAFRGLAQEKAQLAALIAQENARLAEAKTARLKAVAEQQKEEAKLRKLQDQISEAEGVLGIAKRDVERLRQSIDGARNEVSI